MPSSLPSLKDLKAFDGEKEEATIPRDVPLPKKCLHATAEIVSSRELKCKCGVTWTGENIQRLHELLTTR